MSVITAVTAQNSLGVQGVFNLPPEFVGRQIDSVLSDFGADAIKIGMLATAPIIAVVAERLRAHAPEKVVLDPVMIAKSGDALLQPEARTALIKEILPLALVVTPNLYEAEALAGMTVSTESEMEEAARIAMSPVRDPEVMRRACEEMDRISEEIYQKHGLLDIGVPAIRELRDGE